jgi:hypothetical protein
MADDEEFDALDLESPRVGRIAVARIEALTLFAGSDPARPCARPCCREHGFVVTAGPG